MIKAIFTRIIPLISLEIALLASIATTLERFSVLAGGNIKNNLSQQQFDIFSSFKSLDTIEWINLALIMLAGHILFFKFIIPKPRIISTKNSRIQKQVDEYNRYFKSVTKEHEHTSSSTSLSKKNTKKD